MFHIKKILLIITISFITSSSFATKYELTNPINVAKTSYELGMKFMYDELKTISCDDISNSLHIAENQAEKAIQLFKNNGIDFNKDVEYDFSFIQYKLINKNEKGALVNVYGNYTIKAKDKYEKKTNVDNSIVLKKIDSDYYFCGMK